MGWAYSSDEARRLSYYLGEIEYQASIARQGVTLMLDQGPDARRRFMWAQMFLGACASMSKQLWPVNRNKKSKWRAASLRALLKVGDGSVLRSRDARNWLEHIDEKFDDLLMPGVNTADFFIMPKSLVNVSSMNYLRCMDETTETLSIAGLDVPYRVVWAETDRLGVEAAARKSDMEAIWLGRTADR